MALEREASVFLNVPFDRNYEPLFIALIAGLAYLGRRPRCVLEIPAVGATRRDRILELIRSCEVSIHDLSRVQGTTVHGERLPRFNMPFELGLAIAVSSMAPGPRKHQFALLEEHDHRLPITLSDGNGLDAHAHGATQAGIVACLLDIFGGGRAGDMERVLALTRRLSRFFGQRKRAQHLGTIYRRDLFQQGIAAATALIDRQGGWNG